MEDGAEAKGEPATVPEFEIWPSSLRIRRGEASDGGSAAGRAAAWQSPVTTTRASASCSSASRCRRSAPWR